MNIRKRALAGAVAVTLGSLLLSAQTREFQPVTDAMLQKPAAGEWLHWRGTQDAWGYSPLDQINRGNVGQLQLAWSWAMPQGSAEPAPLVHDGVMYIPQPGGGVQALDAVTGDLLWDYSRKYPSENLAERPMRSIGLYGDKVFVNTPDAHMVGLNARTGALVWDHMVADHKLGYLDPDSGKINWYHQFLPGETQDMDEVFESILVDRGGRQSLFKMGKLGILWELDRKTGAYVASHDLGYQNILNVDAQTGKVTYRPGMIPEIGKALTFCPSTAGFKDWRAMAFSPQTQAFYIPMALTCERAIFEEVPRAEGNGGTGPVDRTNLFHPASPEGLGEFTAMDANGKVLWRYRTRTPMNTAALTTAGGLAIVGDWDRNLYVFDAANGKILYQTRMPTSVQGFPISYAVRGKQYLAIPVGTGGGSWGTQVPVLGTGGGSWGTQVPVQLTPDKQRRDNANAIYVFALPGR